MEVYIEIFIVVICTIWGVLSIILFFKVWGMCNNVSSILQILVEKEEDADENEEKIVVNSCKLNQPNEDNTSRKQDLMMAFYDDCLKLYKKCKSKQQFDDHVDEIITKYNRKSEFDFSTLKNEIWEQFKLL